MTSERSWLIPCFDSNFLRSLRENKLTLSVFSICGHKNRKLIRKIQSSSPFRAVAETNFDKMFLKINIDPTLCYFILGECTHCSFHWPILDPEKVTNKSPAFEKRPGILFHYRKVISSRREPCRSSPQAAEVPSASAPSGRHRPKCRYARPSRGPKPPRWAPDSASAPCWACRRD